MSEAAVFISDIYFVFYNCLFFYLWTTDYGSKKYIGLKEMYYQTVISRIESFLFEAIGRGFYPKKKHSSDTINLIYDLILAGCLKHGMNLDRRSLNHSKHFYKKTIDEICKNNNF